MATYIFRGMSYIFSKTLAYFMIFQGDVKLKSPGNYEVISSSNLKSPRNYKLSPTWNHLEICNSNLKYVTLLEITSWFTWNYELIYLQLQVDLLEITNWFTRNYEMSYLKLRGDFKLKSTWNCNVISSWNRPVNPNRFQLESCWNYVHSNLICACMNCC